MFTFLPIVTNVYAYWMRSWGDLISYYQVYGGQSDAHAHPLYFCFPLTSSKRYLLIFLLRPLMFIFGCCPGSTLLLIYFCLFVFYFCFHFVCVLLLCFRKVTFVSIRPGSTLHYKMIDLHHRTFAIKIQ